MLVATDRDGNRIGRRHDSVSRQVKPPDNLSCRSVNLQHIIREVVGDQQLLGAIRLDHCQARGYGDRQTIRNGFANLVLRMAGSQLLQRDWDHAVSLERANIK